MPESIIQTQDNIELVDMAQILRNAKIDGEKRALSGFKCQTRADLLNKYCAQAVDAYIQAYEEFIKNPKVLQIAEYNGLKAVEKTGRRYGRDGNHGGQRPQLKNLIKKNNYTEEQAKAYLRGFDIINSSEEKRSLRIAKQAASVAVNRGYRCATSEYLKEKHHYTEAQVEAYLQKYVELAAAAEKRELQKAKTAAYRQAVNIGKCPTRNVLLKKYSQKAIDVYLQSFDETISRAYLLKTPEQRAIMNAKKAGAACAKTNGKPTLPIHLKIRNDYTDEQVEAYLQAFHRARSKMVADASKKSKSADSSKLSKIIKVRKAKKRKNQSAPLTHNDLQNSHNNAIPQAANCLLPGFDSFCRVANSVANKVLLPSFTTFVEGANTINPRSTSLRK